MATIVRPTITDDDGSGTTGTVLNAAFFADVFDKIDALHSPKRCLAYHNAVQSIPDAAWTALLMGAEDSDPSAMHSTVSNTSRITIPTGAGGLYLLTATVVFAVDTTAGTIRGLTFKKNNAVVGPGVQVAHNGSASLEAVVTHTQLLVLAANDYVEACAYHNTGGALNVGHASTRSLQSQFQLVQLA